MEFVQALAILAGVVISAYNLRNLPDRTRKRSTLKADIEIYHLLDKSDPQRESVKRSIDATLDRLYGGRSRSFKDVEWSFVIGLCLTFVGFGAWTAYQVRDGFTWWAVATGFVALSVLLALPEALEPRTADGSDDDHGAQDDSSGTEEDSAH
ncbi:MAG: hypothetical protein ACRD1T_08985 [Acidimicrobiia bacterium]